LVEECLYSISSSVNKKSKYNTLRPITKELVGIIKIKGKMDYKELLTDALAEKYL
jgi:hypothetical protein